MDHHTNLSTRCPAWLSAGGIGLLCVGLSVGLHGVLLGLPVPVMPPPEEPPVSPEPSASEPLISVVDLPRPPASEPELEPEFQPEPAPGPVPSPPPDPKPVPALTPQPVPDPPAAPDPNPDPPNPDPPNPDPPNPDPRLDYSRYRPNGQGKTADELDRIAFEALPLLLEQYPDARIANEYRDTLTLTYPLSTCLPQLPSPGRLLAVVWPDGTLAAPPRWVAGTGYDLLDEQALEQAIAHRFDPPPDQLALYSLDVVTDYDPATCTPPAPL